MLECCCGEDGCTSRWRGARWVILGSLEKLQHSSLARNLGKREYFLFRLKCSIDVAKFILTPKIAPEWMLWCFMLYRYSLSPCVGRAVAWETPMLAQLKWPLQQQRCLPGVPGIRGHQKGSLKRLKLQYKPHILTVMSLGNCLGLFQVHTSLWISGDECCVSWLFHFHHGGCSPFLL